MSEAERAQESLKQQIAVLQHTVDDKQASLEIEEQQNKVHASLCS